MKYRPDIDGLRGIAVLAVILFHAGVERVPGGFIGVDVFFVISGYLITSPILEDIEKGRFSIVRFYERRARRLLPALFVVLLFTSITAYRTLLPQDLQDYAASMFGTLFFASNFVFWKESGYFDRPAETKPLLHTWSLGVEEQFYLFLPLFLFLIWRCFRKRYTLAIAVTLLISFGASTVFVRTAPKAAFYLAPFRIWELLTGAILALHVLPEKSNPVLAGVLGISGLALIGYGAIAFTRTTPFPGPHALVPVLGAGLVIYSGSMGRNVITRALSLKPMVLVGLISYSLYLWHWVLLVFARYLSFRTLTPLATGIVVIAACAIAFLSWRFVETPVRRGEALGSRRWLFSSAALIVCLFIADSAAAYFKDGLPGRLNSEARALIRGQNDYWARTPECLNNAFRAPTPTTCRIGNPTSDPSFILWGDSHAATIAPIIDRLARAKMLAGTTVLHSDCLSLVGQADSKVVNYPLCTEVNSAAFGTIRASGIKNVILHARWTRYVEQQDQYPALEQLLGSTLRELQQFGANVIVIASTSEPGINVPIALARAALSGIQISTALPEQNFLRREERTLSLLREVGEKYRVRIFYPHELLCDGSNCPFVKDGRALYTDEHHLSIAGAELLTPQFQELLGEDLK
jgi:peptidoglycan/LPS O-acetylase OafA/YrhL